LAKDNGETELEFRHNPNYQDLRGEVTPESMFIDRRKLLATGGILGAGTILGALPACSEPQGAVSTPAGATNHAAPGAKLIAAKSAYTVADGPTQEDAFYGFNNFYEFGTDKEAPAANSFLMTTSPWQIKVEGETDAPGNYAIKDLVDYSKLEERVYRHRCVERWSMVIPWVGVPLSSVIAKLKPKATAKYVAFETYLNRKEMIGVRDPILQWPYREGLRMDEAMNELTLVAVGAYGKALQKQNGAPIRTIIPWKYGYKSTKSIVKIRFVADEPPTAWNKYAPNEYGFYSNVNPAVRHPRWSQEMEQVIGGKGFNPQRKTEMFNGYEKQVAKLYAGMDLQKYH
jgi:methionine sulfoxide reductase catalytic subunit